MASEDEETYTVPLQNQRVFGAGLKRKRVAFVRASSPTVTQPTTSSSNSIAAKYLSIVLPSSSAPASPSPAPSADGTHSAPPSTSAPHELCPVCDHPISPTAPHRHDASITHQLALPHSHPPSSVDRGRRGLRYLQSYGWDPDARAGLGARGEGITAPIKAREKRDTAGLGLVEAMRREAEATGGDPARVRERVAARVEKERKLGAKEVREMEEQKRKRGERLMRMFHENRDLERYLGPAAD